MHRNWERSIVVGCVLLAAGVPASAAVPVVKSRNLTRAAAVAPDAGKRVRLEGIRKAGTGETAAFELERFEVFTPGARVTVHGPHGDEVLPPPANAYFRGTVAGRSDSRVFLAVLPDGTAQGIVNEGEESYLIGGEDAPVANAKGARAPWPCTGSTSGISRPPAARASVATTRPCHPGGPPSTGSISRWVLRLKKL